MPVGLAALALVAVARPPNVRSGSRHLDLVSLTLLVFGLSAVVLGLQQSTVWSLPVCVVVIVLGAAALAALLVLPARRSAALAG